MAGSIVTARLDYRRLKEQVALLAIQSSRTLPDIVNQTALNAVGRAFNHTPRADRNRIQMQTAQLVKVNKINKRGKIVTETKLGHVTMVTTKKGNEAPLLALIINSRRGKKGLPGLYGAKMTQAIVRVLKFRLRSIGFEASGWIPGMKQLMARLRRPFIIANLKGVAVYKRPKGEATAARPGFRSIAQVVNNVREIAKVGTRALQRGIDEEAASIQKHLEKKMAPHAEEFNRRSR